MASVRRLDAAEQRMWRGYLDYTRLLLQALDRQLARDAGLSFTDFEILVVLSEAPARRMRMRELADAMTTTRGGVTRAVSRLVGAGWVRRVECEDDKRGTLAELTDKGGPSWRMPPLGMLPQCARTCSIYSAAVTSIVSPACTPTCATICAKALGKRRAHDDA